MFCLSKIPSNHPSFVEVEENENVVEKFKEGVVSVHNILALDRLKQEFCLKKKLAKSGQLLHHPTQNIAAVDEEIIHMQNSNHSEDALFPKGNPLIKQCIWNSLVKKLVQIFK